eukprot:1149658-Pelagomonas_calceolata.AAC.2
MAACMPSIMLMPCPWVKSSGAANPVSVRELKGLGQVSHTSLSSWLSIQGIFYSIQVVLRHPSTSPFPVTAFLQG